MKFKRMEPPRSKFELSPASASQFAEDERFGVFERVDCRFAGHGREIVKEFVEWPSPFEVVQAAPEKEHECREKSACLRLRRVPRDHTVERGHWISPPTVQVYSQGV